MKHTPGPWNIVGREGHAAFGERWVVFQGDEYNHKSQRIAVVSLGGLPAGDQELSTANARLIAAAPDLLAACEDALITLQAVKHFLHDHELDSIEYLKLAIAKAEGEQP